MLTPKKLTVFYFKAAWRNEDSQFNQPLTTQKQNNRKGTFYSKTPFLSNKLM